MSKIGNLHRLLKQHAPFDLRKYPFMCLLAGKALLSDLLSKLESVVYANRLKRYHMPKPPIFVIGHWRSGTSFLQSLLGAPPGYVYFNKYQTIFPDSFLLTRHVLKPAINYLMAKSSFVKSWKDGVTHDFDSLDTASEIEVAIMNQFEPFSFHWGQVFPDRYRYYFDRYLFMDNISHDLLERWKKDVHMLHKKVNFTDRRARLIVKNPGDTARVKYLRQLYPDACFIFIHRNPYDVFYSSRKLWSRIVENIGLQDIDTATMDRAIRYIYKRMHRRYFGDRKEIPANKLIEIRYDQLVNRPLNTLQIIAERLEVPNFEKLISHYQDYLHAHPHQPSQYVYEERDVEQLDDDWGFVFETLGYAKHSDRAFGLVAVHKDETVW